MDDHRDATKGRIESILQREVICQEGSEGFSNGAGGEKNSRKSPM